MTLKDDVRSSYDVVLRDLESERQQVQEQLGALGARLKDLNHGIHVLTQRINPDATISSQATLPSRPPNQKYANMSVRWAILDLLSGSTAMATAEIADALISAGVQTRAANFANNVSAVLSTTMKEQHGEVQQLPDGKWELTDKGHEAIEYIRTTPKFRGALRGRY